MNLDDWQKEIIEHDGNILLCTGRQVGKTTCFAIKSAKYMIKNPKSRILVVSLTEDQAKLIIVMTLHYLETHHKKIIGVGKNKPTLNKITLKNGSTMLARPVGNTGDALRGFTGDVLIIDEASRMPEIAFTAAKPVLLTTAGQLWLCSTPFGKQGYFWEAYQNKNNRFKVFHKSSEEVIKNRTISSDWTEKKREEALKFLESERADMTELQYGQEYLGMFLDDLRRFFDDKLIEQCCMLKRPIPSPKEYNYLGVDIARMGDDESSFEIIHAPLGKKFKQIENITTKKQLTTETEKRIIELTNQFNCGKVGIDAGSGSLGVGIYDHLKDSKIKKCIVPMNNRQISMDREGKKRQRIFKEDLYDNLKSMMEHGEILLLDDDNIKASLRSIQFEFNQEDKGLRFTRVKIFGNYAHITEGLIRAAWLAKKERIKNFFIDYL
jgi:hypothetical protein